MDLREIPQSDQQEVSRRRLLRKAAYVAPVVFAIAEAPNVALGKSGNNGKGKDKGKNKKRRKK